MKRLHVLVVDEAGGIVMHGPVESYEMRREYDNYYDSSPFDPPIYLPRPTRVEIVCSHVQSGPPAIQAPPAGRPHNWAPITNLSRTCQDCGHRETLFAAMAAGGNYPTPPCPGKASPAAPGARPMTPAEQEQLTKDLVGAIRDAIKVKAKGCECGATKSSGAARGSPAHSSWCPWSRP